MEGGKEKKGKKKRKEKMKRNEKKRKEMRGKQKTGKKICAWERRKKGKERKKALIPNVPTIGSR